MATSIALLAQESAIEAQRWFSGMHSDERFILTIIAVGCATGAIIMLASIGAAVWSSAHRRRMEMEFKREMLERGMSAADVAKVIEAAPLPEDGLGRWLASCSKKT